MNKILRDFEQFMKQREGAARAYAGGDAEPLSHIATRISPSTYYAPKGGYVAGADDVLSTYERDAALFESGGDSEFEIIQLGANDGIAYWTGFQRARVRMRGSAEPISFNLRVTEVFRNEGDGWKLVHRHADPLASEPGANKE